MYDPIFSKSFSHYERRKFGCYGLIMCMIIAFTICSTFKPHLHPLSLIGDVMELPLSINSVEDFIIEHDTVEYSMQKVGNKNDVEEIHTTNETVEDFEPEGSNGKTNWQLSMNAAENMKLVSDTSAISQPKVEKKVIPLCRVLSSNADYCEIEGDIRIQPNSSTIFVVASSSHESLSNQTNSWIIQPYPRKGIPFVKHWTVKIVEDSNSPMCTQTHNISALLFSIGGFTGNHFHDFTDLLFPLYWTSSHFKKDVHFLASDVKPWWIGKYRQILNMLSKHEIVNIDREYDQVHCYKKMVAGVKFNKEFIMDQSDSEFSRGVSMQNFRQLLRQTYSLERKTATKSRKGKKTSPRLLIVSRKKSRILINEDEVSTMAQKLGFEVVSAEAEISTSLAKFTQIVNSCDVMLGVHGAGLTNMLFLPDNAVLIQVIPLGKIDGFAKLDFGNPAPGMNLKYLEYKITTKESSLSQQYPIDHPILKDPMSFHRQGWNTIKKVYLMNQNVTVDIGRFKGTLVKALKLLRH